MRGTDESKIGILDPDTDISTERRVAFLPSPTLAHIASQPRYSTPNSYKMADPIPKPTIVLVQGSFQLPDVYYELADALRNLGYPVVQPPLPSVTGQDRPDFTSKTLTDDALAVRSEIKRLVEEENQTVVVLMHSYGGLVGSEAVTRDLAFDERKAKGLPGGVKHLFYVAAFVLREGQTVLGVFGESPNSDIKPDGRFTMKTPAHILYHDLPGEKAEYWASRIVDQSYAVQTTKITNTAYSFITSTYVVCENDRGPPPQFQEMFGTSAGATIRKINSGHSPMLSHTSELVAMFEETVRSVVGNV